MRRAREPSLLVIDPKDNVAVALRDLAPGAEVILTVHGRARRISVLDPIPVNHKLAIARIRSGAAVVKYGEAIGEATTAIRAGSHVHIHNLQSRRVRPRKRQAAPRSHGGSSRN
jgi:altronate dehydratase small subunit